MNEYRIIKRYWPRENKWYYYLQQKAHTRSLGVPRDSWSYMESDIGRRVSTSDTEFAREWNRLCSAPVYKENPATGELKLYKL